MGTYTTEYTKHTDECIERARHETGLDYVVRYWNHEYHILIGNRHVFCGPEYVCRAYLEGATCSHKWIREHNRDAHNDIANSEF